MPESTGQTAPPLPGCVAFRTVKLRGFPHCESAHFRHPDTCGSVRRTYGLSQREGGNVPGAGMVWYVAGGT